MEGISVTNKHCLIKQRAGLGDIILGQKIADFFIAEGYSVFWPVIDEYYDAITTSMKKEGITYCRERDEFPLKELYNSPNNTPIIIKETEDLYIPIQMADQHFPGESALRSKFKILGLTADGWQDHFLLHRDNKKEELLFSTELGLSMKEEYVLVNYLYGSPPTTVRKDIPLDSDLRIVEITMKEGYSMFDWSKVIENASEIYCVDTSLFYLIDILNLKATKLEAYSKFEPANYMHTDGLFKASWNYNE